jgi:hypothetical protein
MDLKRKQKISIKCYLKSQTAEISLVNFEKKCLLMLFTFTRNVAITHKQWDKIINFIASITDLWVRIVYIIKREENI